MRSKRAVYTGAFIIGLLVVFMPPVGLICLCILLRDWRLASRSHGEATESVSRMLTATKVAPGTIAEPRRPREREAWTQIMDYAAPPRKRIFHG